MTISPLVAASDAGREVGLESDWIDRRSARNSAASTPALATGRAVRWG
ncbi:MAG: hypothetical protein ACYDEH_02190 [Acidimicrobiales bacterium]